jgi:hypothetical protein
MYIGTTKHMFIFGHPGTSTSSVFALEVRSRWCWRRSQAVLVKGEQQLKANREKETTYLEEVGLKRDLSELGKQACSSIGTGI